MSCMFSLIVLHSFVPTASGTANSEFYQLRCVARKRIRDGHRTYHCRLEPTRSRQYTGETICSVVGLNRSNIDCPLWLYGAVPTRIADLRARV